MNWIDGIPIFEMPPNHPNCKCCLIEQLPEDPEPDEGERKFLIIVYRRKNVR